MLDDPVTFEGKYFQVKGATLLPRPNRANGPRILVGGNGEKKTLRWRPNMRMSGMRSS